MPEVVNADPGKFSALKYPLELLTHARRLERPASILGEYQVELMPRRACYEPLLKLVLAMHAQSCKSPGGKMDSPPTAGGLRLYKD